MLLDIAAWAFILGVATATGDGVLALLGTHRLRSGDRFILAAWSGIVTLSLVLLAVSLAVPLSPRVALVTAALLAGAGALTSVGLRHRRPHAPADPSISRTAIVVGAAVIALGTASLTTDPVTLYDSLVYHVGIMRWLHEYGTVPGVALIHNRLGHVSSWFALSAPFDTGPAAGRAANTGLGVALVMVALQGAIGAARVAAPKATASDWFLALSSLALIWPVVAYDAASPSPDVATTVLLVVIAWSMMVVGRAESPRHGKTWERLLDAWLLPFVLAIGAASMKLFALPAVLVIAFYYTLAPGQHIAARSVAARAAVCTGVGLALIAPLIAANVVSTGCPLFPSPIGCVDVPWSLGSDNAATYGEYIRNVARFESRQSISAVPPAPWLGAWVRAHPVVTALMLIAPALIAVQLRRPRQIGARAAMSIAAMGIPFSMWLAPAPRFLYAFLIIVTTIPLAFQLTQRTQRRPGLAESAASDVTHRASGFAFIAFAFVAGAAYALASQKLNVRSWARGGSPLVSATRADLILPAAPEPPPHLYRWRVNDFDVFTPVPRPVADTLGYHSDIDGDIGFEKCSAAPLPCTPYLPTADVRLRVPARGIGGGFVRDERGTTLTAGTPRCVGELRPPFHAAATLAPATPDGAAKTGCGIP